MPPTVAEREACAELGFAYETILQSIHWTDLGPTSGLSHEGRLLRWIDILKINTRELSEHFFDPARLQPELDAAVRQEVDALNRCAEAPTI